MFEKTFLSISNMSQDKEYCVNLWQLLKEKMMQETAVQIKTMIEMHDTEKENFKVFNLFAPFSW